MVIYIQKELVKTKNLTQNEVILLHLLKNGFITNKQASDNYGYHHLPGIIRVLKKMYGCRFENVRQKEMFNRFSQKTEYDEYHLRNREEIRKLLNIQL